jgi:hypothetical protein
VKPAPAETIEPRGNTGFDNAVIVLPQRRGNADVIVCCGVALYSLDVHCINQ